jgi:hypothetical protein
VTDTVDCLLYRKYRGKNITTTPEHIKYLSAFYDNLWFRLLWYVRTACLLSGEWGDEMTNKMKVIFAIVSTVSTLFVVILSTPFAIDTGEEMLSALAGIFGLHEEITLFALAVLVIPGLYLYFALGQKRHS